MASSIPTSPISNPVLRISSPKLPAQSPRLTSALGRQSPSRDLLHLKGLGSELSFDDLMKQTHALIGNGNNLLASFGATPSQLNTVQAPDALIKAQEVGTSVNQGMIDTLKKYQGQNISALDAAQKQEIKQRAFDDVKKMVPLLVAGTTPEKAFEKYNAPGKRAESLSMLDVEKAFAQAGHKVDPFKGAYEYALEKLGSKKLLEKIRKV